MARREKKRSPAICPVCGEDVPSHALACPECGADHNSGWREEVESYDGVDLPEEFDYNEFIEKEFNPSPKLAGMSTIWWVTAIVLVVVTLIFLVSR